MEIRIAGVRTKRISNGYGLLWYYGYEFLERNLRMKAAAERFLKKTFGRRCNACVWAGCLLSAPASVRMHCIVQGRQASKQAPVALRRSLPSLCFTFTLKWHPTADRRTMQCRRGGVWSEQLPLPVWFLPLPACASAVCALCVRLRQLPFDRRTTASSTARRFAKHETRAHACETRRERRRECRAQECCRLDSR